MDIVYESISLKISHIEQLSQSITLTLSPFNRSGLGSSDYRTCISTSISLFPYFSRTRMSAVLLNMTICHCLFLHPLFLLSYLLLRSSLLLYQLLNQSYFQIYLDEDISTMLSRDLGPFGGYLHAYCTIKYKQSSSEQSVMKSIQYFFFTIVLFVYSLRFYLRPLAAFVVNFDIPRQIPFHTSTQFLIQLFNNSSETLSNITYFSHLCNLFKNSLRFDDEAIDVYYSTSML